MPETLQNISDRTDGAKNLPILHVANYTDVPDGGIAAWGPRRIPDFELILCLSGEFEFLNFESGEHLTQEPGTVLAIYPEELHTFRKKSAGVARFSCLHLDPGPDADFPPRLSRFPEEHALAELFRRVARLQRAPGRFRAEQIALLLRVIWLDVLDSPAAVPPPRLREMLAYLERNLIFHPSRLELARIFHLSPQRVNALFKREFGQSPGDYVHRRLAQRAYELLHVRGLSVKEAAAELGFSNPFYFSRAYKKVYGVSPRSRNARGERPK